jgi:hypothetical protein
MAMTYPSLWSQTMRITYFLAALALLGLSASHASAQPTMGTKTWGNFSFLWAVEDSAGLSLTDVTFNGTKYIHRVSLPVIRVQYDGNACGPYMDRMSTDVITPLNGNYVRFQETSTQLIVSIKAQISAYALEQQYSFNTNGRIDMRLFSSGLQCVVDHRHHPYWRVDADIGDSGNDEIRVRYKDGRVFVANYEYNRNKLTAPQVSNWIFRDGVTNKQMTITPGSGDGSADSFASWDFYARRYKYPYEHMPWANGVSGFADQGDLVLGSHNNEVTGPASPSVDVLGWYVGHLVHPASLGPTQMLSVGPSLMLQ